MKRYARYYRFKRELQPVRISGIITLNTLTELLVLKKRENIAFTGSGGKSTLMYQIAGELAGRGSRVITTTTTKIFVPSQDESPRWMLIKDDMTLFENFWESSVTNNNLTIGWCRLGRKLTGIPLKVLEEIAQWDTVDYLLVEADGSKGKSLKGYMPSEPVISEMVQKTIIVVGLDVLEKTFHDEMVHRPHLVKKIASIKAGDKVMPCHIARLLLHRDGYIQRAGGAEKILIFNLIAENQQYQGALELKERVAAARGDIPVFFRGPFWGIDEKNDYYKTVAS